MEDLQDLVEVQQKMELAKVHRQEEHVVELVVYQQKEIRQEYEEEDQRDEDQEARVHEAPEIILENRQRAATETRDGAEGVVPHQGRVQTQRQLEELHQEEFERNAKFQLQK